MTPHKEKAAARGFFFVRYWRRPSSVESTGGRLATLCSKQRPPLK
jgi:hypothetical protein